MSDRKPRGRPRAFHDTSEQNTIQSLDRAMVILESVAGSGGGTLTEIATVLGQSPATVYRVLTTLQAHAIVELDPSRQSWHIGAGAFRIGSAFLRRTNLVERARPVMRTLMEVTGETANLGVRQGARVLFVSQVETDASIRAFFPPGTLSPLHASGIGKALLAEMSDRDLERILSADTRHAYTSQTLSDPKLLSENLLLTRSRGYAFDDEERTEGMRCVAAPVFDAAGEAVAGISVSGPTSRIRDADIAALAARVRAAAGALSSALGASPTTAACRPMGS